MKKGNWPYQICLDSSIHSREETLGWLRTNLSEKGLGGTARYFLGSPQRSIQFSFPFSPIILERYGFKYEEDYMVFLLRFG